MEFTVIKTRDQYDAYCNILNELLEREGDPDKIELLTLLIENWDNQHNTFNDRKNPIDLIKALMDENNLKAKDLSQILGLSGGTISKILNFRKGLSKETIRKLADHFKMGQEAFNRPYDLIKARREDKRMERVARGLSRS